MYLNFIFCISIRQFFVKHGLTLSKKQNTRSPRGNKHLKRTFCFLWNWDGLRRRISIRGIQNMALSGKLKVKDYREKVVVDNKALPKQRKASEQKRKALHALHLLFPISVHFFPVLGKSATWNDHFSSFKENVNNQGEIWIFFPSLDTVPLNSVPE